MSKKPKGKKRTPRKVRIGVPPFPMIFNPPTNESELLEGLYNALGCDAYITARDAKTPEDVERALKLIMLLDELGERIDQRESGEKGDDDEE